MLNEILSQARARGITLRADGGQLRVSAPAGALTDALRADIRAHKQQLIDLLREVRGGSDAAASRISARPADAPPARLSFPQQRLWMHQQLDGRSTAYHLPFACRTPEDFEPDRAEAAIRVLLTRHEALRTVIDETPQGPRQRVISAEPFRLERLEQAAAGASAEDWIAEQFRAFAARPFDLAQDFMLRVAFAQPVDGAGVLMLVTHHIASDGWSMTVLVEEFAHAYAALARDTTPALPALPVSYADYAEWQHEHLAGPRLDAQLDYWRDQLHELPLVHELPRRRRSDAQEAPVPAGLSRALLDAAQTRAVERMADQHGCTLFVAVHAALAWVLSRYSHSDDIVVGTPVANRRDAQLAGLVGFFVNTLVLRLRTDGGISVADLLARAREINLTAQSNQDVPFEQLVELLSPARSADHTPLFQIMLSQDSTQQRGGEGGDSAVAGAFEVLAPPPGPAKFDLCLSIKRDAAAALVLEATYAPQCFTQSLIAGVVSDTVALLGAWAQLASPAQTAAHEVALASVGSVQALATPAHYAPTQSLDELLRRQANTRPEALALVSDEGSWTFAEFDRMTDRLAGTLMSAGVNVGDVVAVHMRRGPHSAAAFVAAVKCGAAFLPLDPALPLGRRQAILSQAAPSVLLDDHRSPYEATDGLGPRKVTLGEDALDTRAPRSPFVLPSGGDAPQLPAFVLFTSGSTGTPKGAINPRRGLVNFLLGRQQLCPLTPGDRVLHKSALTFDVCVMEVFEPLVYGATIVMAPPGEEGDPHALMARMAAQGVTSADFTPTLLNELLHAQWCPQGHGLRRLTLGGEALTPALLSTLQGWEGIGVFNEYGPTEAAVSVTSWRVRERGDREVPIGRAVPGVHFYVMDQHGRTAPPGARGELYIGGASVGSGYLGAPKRTAERFLRDPGGTGEQLYRSGDLVRCLEDGELAYCGRLDGQLKVRGQRIEVGEIESVLERDEQVLEAAVWAHGEGADRALVAYLVLAQSVADTEQDAQLQTLRSTLRAALPAYMVPAHFVALQCMPRTSSGKLDRKALPAPDLTPEQGTAPATPTEHALAKIWCELLGLEQAWRETDFFVAGGHSLTATRVCSAVRSHFAKALPLASVFEHSTLGALAACVDGLDTAHEIPLTPVPRDGALELSHTQRRLWFIDRFEGGSQHYNMAFALRWRGPLNEVALQGAFTALTQRHEILRTTYAQGESGPEQCVQRVQPVTIHRRDLRSLDSSARPTALAEALGDAARAAFDLQREAPLRVTVVAMGEHDYALSVVVHHIACDGWSVDLLRREFAHFYAALLEHDAVAPLPPLAVQYADFAAWQARYLRSERAQADRAYWREQLHEVPLVHSLPTDRPRRPSSDPRAHSVTTALPAAVCSRLQALTRDEDATLFMTLQSAFALLLARLGRTQDIVMGTPVAGRDDKALEGMVGFFANTLVLRNLVDLEGSFRECLREGKRTALAAFEHQRVPFEQLIDEVRPQRSLDYQPLVQILFTLNHQERAAVDHDAVSASGVSLSPLGSGEAVTRFEIELAAQDDGEGLRLTWNFAARLFESRTAQRIADCFTRLLDEMSARPDDPVQRIALLGEEDRERIAGFNSRRLPLAPVQSVHELVDGWAARTPDATAVTGREAALSYGELARASNRVANGLLAEGVGPEDIVAVVMERSPLLPVAVLGVVKSGAAFLPIDPEAPAARQRYMLEDAGVTLVLTDPARVEDPMFEGYRCVSVGSFEDCVDAPPTVAMTRDQLAYVIYTSGSTGQPKGALLERTGTLNLVANIAHGFELDPSARVLFFASPGFDAAVWEWMVTLSSGATLVVCDGDSRASAGALSEFLVREQVTHAFLPPSLLTQMDPQADYALRYLGVGGEAPDERQTWKWAQRLRVINGYGPTETTVAASFGEVRPGEALTIGRPLANTSVHVLDDAGLAVPIGAVGELHVAGPSIARGYLERPELTAAKFVRRDPQDIGAPVSADGAPVRTYATGDLVRWLDDGRLQFLGRLDDQVNIRGMRIEIGEVQTRLNDLAQVSVGTVQVCEREGHQPVLVAYVVPQGERPSTRQAQGAWTRAVREHLGEQLPAYMVPATYVLLDELPLTRNGKVDTKALPPVQFDQASEYVAPATALEGQLAQLWASSLGVEQVSVELDFFAAGGHSLLAMGLVSSINEALGCELGVRALFEYPTIRRLAAHLTRASTGGADWSPLVWLQRDAALPTLYLLPGAGLSALSYQLLGKALGQRFNLCVLEARGFASEQGTHDCVDSMCDEYLQALREVQPEGPYLLAGHSVGAAFAFALASRLEAQGASASVLMIDGTLPLEGAMEESVSEHEALSALVRQAQLLAGGDTQEAPGVMATVEERKAYLGQLLASVGILPRSGYAPLLDGLVRVYLAQVNLFQTLSLDGRLSQGRAAFLYAKSIWSEPLLEEALTALAGVCDQPVIETALAGGHNTILSVEHVGALADALVEVLETILVPQPAQRSA